MHVRVELTGGRAAGKTHLGGTIARLLEAEALRGTTWEVVTRLRPGGRVTVEHSGGEAIPIPGGFQR